MECRLKYDKKSNNLNQSRTESNVSFPDVAQARLMHIEPDLDDLLSYNTSKSFWLFWRLNLLLRITFWQLSISRISFDVL